MSDRIVAQIHEPVAETPVTNLLEHQSDNGLAGRQEQFEGALKHILSLASPFRPDLKSEPIQTLHTELQPYGIFPNAFRFVSPLLKHKYFSTDKENGQKVLSEKGLRELQQNEVKEFSQVELMSMITDIGQKLVGMENMRERKNSYHKALHNLEVLQRDLLILLAHSNMAEAKRLLPTLDENQNTVEEILAFFPSLLESLKQANVSSSQIAERIVSSGFHDFDHTGRTLRISSQHVAIDRTNAALSADKKSVVLRGIIATDGEKVTVMLGDNKKIVLDTKIAQVDGDNVTVPLDGKIFRISEDVKQQVFLEISSPYNQTNFSNEEVAGAHAIKYAFEKGFTLPQLLRINQRIINTTFGANPRITPFENGEMMDEDGWELSFGADMGAFATSSLEKYLERGCKQVVEELPLRRQQPHTFQRPSDVLSWVRGEYGFFNFFIRDTVEKKLPVVNELFGDRLSQKIQFLERLKADLTGEGQKAIPTQGTSEYADFVQQLLNQYQEANDGKTLPGKDTAEYAKLVTDQLNIYIARHAEDNIPQDPEAFAEYISSLKNTKDDAEYHRCKALVLEYLRPLVTREY